VFSISLPCWSVCVNDLLIRCQAAFCHSIYITLMKFKGKFKIKLERKIKITVKNNFTEIKVYRQP